MDRRVYIYVEACILRRLYIYSPIPLFYTWKPIEKGMDDDYIYIYSLQSILFQIYQHIAKGIDRIEYIYKFISITAI